MIEDMNDLQSFMQESAVKAEDKFYVASKRFLDAKKEPIKWQLRVVSNKEIDTITQSARHKEYNPKTREYKMITDNDKFCLGLVCASVVYPNLNNAKLQESYGVIGAEQLIKAMLTPGEYTDLVAAVSEVCGFQAEMADKIKTAKN